MDKTARLRAVKMPCGVRADIFTRYNAITRQIRRAQKLLLCSEGPQAKRVDCEILRLQRRLSSLIKTIGEKTEEIPNDRIAGVMRMRYLCGMSVEDIAAETYYQKRSVERFLQWGRGMILDAGNSARNS